METEKARKLVSDIGDWALEGTAQMLDSIAPKWAHMKFSLEEVAELLHFMAKSGGTWKPKTPHS